MSDASTPLRPSAQSPLDRVLAGVGAQTSRARRRLNRVALEHALFVTVGTAMLSLSALVILAFVLSPRGYAWATWLIFVVVAATIAVHLRRVRTSWVRGTDAALVIDHRVGLEDRLATLATADAAARRSRLWSFLIRENLRLLPRWEPRRLAPRSVPMSIWYFICSLLLAALVSYRIPRPGFPAPLGESTERPAATPSGQSDTRSAEPVAGRSEEPSRLWTDLPERLRQAILGPRSSRKFAGSIPPRTAPVTDEKGGPAIVGSRIGNSGPVRSAPATADTTRLASPSGTSRSTLPHPGNDQQVTRGQAESSAAPAHGDPPKTLPGKLRGDRPKSLAKDSTGGAGGGGGAGTGGDKEGLFGERQAGGRAAGSFALDLDALRGSQSDQEGEDGEPGARLEATLSAGQRLDDAVRRAQVPAEYEKIVQRIFNRSAEDVNHPPGRERGADGGTR
jgi:hypothetical protein